MEYEEQAAEWCSRIADSTLGSEEQERFDAWLRADRRHRQAFEEMVTVWQGTNAIAEMPGFLSLRAKALTTMERAREGAWRSSRHGWYRVMAAAAMLLVAMSSLWFFAGRPDTYGTGIGERRVVHLEDGSRVLLDASSAVTVDFERDRRSLTLKRGRAKFDVAKDPLRPFAVTAGQKTIVATGTAFSVELLRGQMRVLLYEGHIAVLARPAAGKPPSPLKIARGSAESPESPESSENDQSLAPGDELVASLASASAIVVPANVEQSLSWEAGRLSFTDEPLASAVERVNRYTHTPIVLGDTVIGRLIINGVFDAGDTRSFVSGVVSLYPVAARLEDGQITLVSRSPATR